MQVEEYLFGEKKTRKNRRISLYSMTITISPLVAQPNKTQHLN